MNLSEEERERRRQRARELVAAGKIGGPRAGSGRPRKPRASEVLAERIRGEADEMFTALKRGLGKDVPQSVTNDTVRTMLMIEENERKIIEDEQRHLETMKRDDLIVALASKLAKLAGAGAIDLPVIEGRVVEPHNSGAARELPPAA
jgi:hypothetical protein